MRVAYDLNVEISRLFLTIYLKPSEWSSTTGCGQEIVSYLAERCNLDEAGDRPFTMGSFDFIHHTSQ